MMAFLLRESKSDTFEGTGEGWGAKPALWWRLAPQAGPAGGSYSAFTTPWIPTGDKLPQRKWSQVRPTVFGFAGFAVWVWIPSPTPLPSWSQVEFQPPNNTFSHGCNRGDILGAIFEVINSYYFSDLRLRVGCANSAEHLSLGTVKSLLLVVTKSVLKVFER